MVAPFAGNGMGGPQPGSLQRERVAAFGTRSCCGQKGESLDVPTLGQEGTRAHAPEKPHGVGVSICLQKTNRARECPRDGSEKKLPPGTGATPPSAVSLFPKVMESSALRSLKSAST